MNEAWDFTRCVAVLTGEIKIIKKIFVAQENVRQAVMSREWADFDEKTIEVNRLGEEFTILEDERALLFSALADALKGSGSTGAVTNTERSFYSLIMGLPIEERRELSGLYRELKMETLKIRALNETFLAYLNEAKSLTTAYLEAVCPAMGGKLYTRKGRRVSHDLRSIVINNRF